MIRAVIVDDENDARFLLRNLIEEHFADKLELVAEAANIPDAVAAIKKHQPDVVFLDIQLREGTGFDVLKKLEDKNFEVIFVTAYDQYAVKAFEFSALGYLMKPIKIREMKKVVEQLAERVTMLKSSSEKRLKVLVDSFSDDRQIKKLVISHQEGFDVLPLNEIVWLEGDANYTHLHLLDRKRITASRSLGVYEELLVDFGFFRIHQSTIINLSHVRSYQREGGGYIELADGHQAKLSRHRKADFMQRFLS